MAMLLCEHFPELADWDVKIVGTDISQQVLEYARQGRYRRMEVNRGLAGADAGEVPGAGWRRVGGVAGVRAMCEFQCKRTYVRRCRSLPMFDLVLLRNVLLYFPQQDRSRVFGDGASPDGAGWISDAGECGAGGGFDEAV